MNNLKEIRKARHMTQTEVAKRLNISQAALSGWETGKYEPDSESLIRLGQLFNVSVDKLIGREDIYTAVPNAFPMGKLYTLPIVGVIRCGAGGMAVQEIEGYTQSEYDSETHFMLRAYGDSMEPEIRAGDLVIIHMQEEVESGEIAAVMVDKEEGILKKVIRQENALSLVSLNPKYEPRIFVGEDIDRVRILGKAIEAKHKL